ncbi:MAG: hypothetical protein J6W33_00980 [Spirochaetia bacterium]|nr:hypothetical protein [Spirochaetia bacterium]
MPKFVVHYSDNLGFAKEMTVDAYSTKEAVDRWHTELFMHSIFEEEELDEFQVRYVTGEDSSNIVWP